MNQKKKYLLTLSGLLATFAPALGETIAVGAFSMNNFSGWNEKSFKGRTVYEFVKDDQINKTVMQAHIQGAASGRFKKSWSILPECLC